MPEQGTYSICRVGYALNAKKLRKGDDSDKQMTKNVHSLREIVLSKYPGHECKNRTETSSWRGGGLADIISDGEEIEGVQFIPWDYEVPVHQQPTFHVIIHKLTEEIDRKEPSEKILALQEYLRLHPSTVIVDSFEAVHLVTSRARSCAALGRIIQHRHFEFARSHTIICSYNRSAYCFSQPRFVAVRPEDYAMGPDRIMRMMSEAGFGFPVICKPVEACGTPNSHSMAVVVSAAGLDLVRPPCIVQEYRDHDEIFFKVYVMGDEVMVFRRPSLPNLDALALIQQNINRTAMERLKDRKESNMSHCVTPMMCHNNGCSSDESKPENGDGHVPRHDHRTINPPVNCTERYLGLRSVAFDSRFAYPTASDFIDPNFNASEVISSGHQDVSSINGHGNGIEVFAVSNVVDEIGILSSSGNSNGVAMTSTTLPSTPSSSSSRTLSPLPIAVPSSSFGTRSKCASSTVSPTMMTMMPPVPGDSNDNNINTSRSSSATRRTSSILTSEGRARKPSGKDLPIVCPLHSLPNGSVATTLSSSLVNVDEATATVNVCALLVKDTNQSSSSSSAEEKVTLNGFDTMTSSTNNSMIMVSRGCQCHEVDRTKENETKCLCGTDNGNNNHHILAAGDGSASHDLLQHVQHQHQHGFDFALSASNLGNLSQERFRAAAKAISAEFGLTLFGFDVIVPISTSSHRHRHHAIMGKPPPPHQSGDKNGIYDDGDTHDRFCNCHGVRACNGVKGSCLSQERGRIRSSSHHSDGGSIEEEIDNAIASITTGPCSSSSWDNFDGDNGHLVVIDVNFFPSYKEVPDFPQRLRKFLRKKAGMV